MTVTRGHNTHVHIHTRTGDKNDENGSKTTNVEQQHIVAKEDRVSPIMSNNSQKLPTTERVIKSELSQTYHCIIILHSLHFCFLFILMIVPFLTRSSYLPRVSRSCRSRIPINIDVRPPVSTFPTLSLFHKSRLDCFVEYIFVITTRPIKVPRSLSFLPKSVSHILFSLPLSVVQTICFHGCKWMILSIFDECDQILNTMINISLDERR